jgi:hypothetical protein
MVASVGRRVLVVLAATSLVMTGLIVSGSLNLFAGADTFDADFHLTCPATQVARIDPIRKPGGGTGSSHVHIFFANNNVLDTSTPGSLNSNDVDTGTNYTTCAGFYDPTGVSSWQDHANCHKSNQPQESKNCADLAAYWTPVTYLCGIGVANWNYLSLGYEYDGGYFGADAAADSQGDCGGGNGTGNGAPCASGDLVTNIGSNCNYFGGDGPNVAVKTAGATGSFPKPVARAYYDSFGLANPPTNPLVQFKPDQTGTLDSKPSIVAGFGGGVALDNAHNTVAAGGGNSSGRSPLAFKGPNNEYGKVVVRFSCGANNTYASPNTSRPYDCDWAREDCYYFLTGNGTTDDPSCDSAVDGVVIIVNFPQCWGGNSNGFVEFGTKDSSGHYAYGSNMGLSGATCTGVSDQAQDMGTFQRMPTLSVRYHTYIADPCYRSGLTNLMPSNPDMNCAPDRSLLTHMPGGVGSLKSQICYDTLSNVHDTQTCSQSGAGYIDLYETMGLAGTDLNGGNTVFDVHPYWTAHADFMDGWGQKLLEDLVQQCMNGLRGSPPCAGLN